MYKFMIYTLLKNKFNALSGEYISKIGAEIVNYYKKKFIKHKMGAVKLESYLLRKQDVKSYGKNSCVVDYVWSQVKIKMGFKSYDYDRLKNEIYSYVYKPPMVNTEELIQWARECHTKVSIHAFDATYKKSDILKSKYNEYNAGVYCEGSSSVSNYRRKIENGCW